MTPLVTRRGMLGTVAALMASCCFGFLAAPPLRPRSRPSGSASPQQLADPCDTDRTSTAFYADGLELIEQPRTAGRRPPIDCFYVYPTITDQVGPNANLEIGQEHRGIANAQASRFSEACRVFAPMYRQVTVPGLIYGMASGGVDPAARQTAYADVRSAWLDYLRNYNHGRGVVLVGHSQGTGALVRLAAEEIDSNPAVRRRLVSALLIGGSVAVRKGRDAGGDFRHIPACRSDRQLGCVVAYNSYLYPPRESALFGGDTERSATHEHPERLEVLCTNPASLGGGAAFLDGYVPTERIPGFVGSQTDPPPDASTPWASFPRLYRGKCRSENGFNWLQVTPPDDPADPRPRVTESLGPDWGLHVLDVNLALGNLVDLVRRQSKAYRTRRARR